MKFKFDWFLTGMVLAMVLAWLVPEPGAAGGVLQPELLTKLGIALIFFLHGVALSFPSLKAGVVASMTVTIGSTHPISYLSP